MLIQSGGGSPSEEKYMGAIMGGKYHPTAPVIQEVYSIKNCQCWTGIPYIYIYSKFDLWPLMNFQITVSIRCFVLIPIEYSVMLTTVIQPEDLSEIASPAVKSFKSKWMIMKPDDHLKLSTQIQFQLPPTQILPVHKFTCAYLIWTSLEEKEQASCIPYVY